MATSKIKVCVIGAGPSGVSMLYHLVNTFSESNIDVVCFEKQSVWGGQWNLQMCTGTDKGDEQHHSAMYKHLWSNGPKECLEFPSYTFEQHFGRPLPSFPPRAVLRDYLEGKWRQSKSDLRELVRFNTVVRKVTYNESSDTFTVTTKHLVMNSTTKQTFTHVIVAAGKYSTPNVPSFPGIETFEGSIVHAHEFRDAENYKDQSILVVGASFSAEDISLLCIKFGAKSVTTSWRTAPMGYTWPKGITERPLVQEIDKRTVTFIDGTSTDIDSIILCTGYHLAFPFMEDRLLLKSTHPFFPGGLYKGLVWTGCGNNKLFYMGIYNILLSFPLFDMQALWIWKYILGTIQDEPKSLSDMLLDVENEVDKVSKLSTSGDYLDYQAGLIARLCKDSGYTTEILRFDQLLRTWKQQKKEDILTYRDQCFKSVFTGKLADKPTVSWWDAFDDSMETFIQ